MPRVESLGELLADALAQDRATNITYETQTLQDYLTSKAASLANNVNNHYYDLGEILWQLKEDGLYKKVDNAAYYSNNHKLWRNFCEDKLSISYRTAQYWLQMFNYFSTMGISKEQLAGIGWSKAKELVDITEDEAVLQDCIEKAKTCTLQELQQYIETFVEQVQGEEVIRGRNFKFKLYESAAEHVDHILNLAAKQTGGDMNDALFKVCTEWYTATSPETYDDIEDMMKIEEVV